MSIPSLGDINMQPLPLVDFTAASKRSRWQRYRQFPSPPKSSACVFTKFCSNLNYRGPDVSLQRPLPHPVCLLLSATIPHHRRSPPTILCSALVRLTGSHRSTGDQGGTHRRARLRSLLQDPNSRVMLSYFPYPCFLDFYSPLHSCK
jgi:hypothetical protein